MKDVTNCREDRELLGWDIRKYELMAQMLSENCFQNKQGDWCKIPKAKTKKLKNLRAMLRKNKVYAYSMIMKEYARRLDHEIQKRNAPKR